MVNYTVTENNIHIVDSYTVSKKTFGPLLKRIHYFYPDCQVYEQRSLLSMEHEWATHNFLYMCRIERERTKDVDINIPMKWYIEWAYFIFGAIAWLFIP